MHPRLNKVITDLENSSQENLVIPYQKNFKDAKGETIGNNTFGLRQEGGSNTKIHLRFDDKTRSDECGRPESDQEMVAHELWHAWSFNNLYGDYLDQANPATGIDRDEEWAVRFQNLVPNTDGGRKVYGTKDGSGTVQNVPQPDYFKKH